MRILKIETAGNGGHVTIGLNPTDVKYFSAHKTLDTIPNARLSLLVNLLEMASLVLSDPEEYKEI